MNPSDYAILASRPYSSLLRELTFLGKLIQSKQLAFTMQAQTQTNWCWAATSTSVSHFYWFLSNWTQCTVANAELGLTDCCNGSVPSACNVAWYLDRALTRTNNFVSITGSVSFQQVRDEIDAGRPVGARIGWNGGGGHFMVIYGYSLVVGTEYFDIDDPIYGKSHLTVADFSSNYQGSGTWTHTYFTKSYFKLPIKIFAVTEPLLRRIWEARPLLDLKLGEPVSAGGEAQPRERDGSVGLAHRVFVLGLDALNSATQDFRPAGVRVYETVGGTPRAFFDLTDEAEPRLLQMSAAPQHLEPFARSLQVALNLAERNPREVEIRLLRIPALNFEGVWIAGDERGQDQVVPLRASESLPAQRALPLAEALEALRRQARVLGDMDDTMGAG